MRTFILAILAAAALAGCAASGRQDARRAPSNPDAAAFMGYHGPVWRPSEPVDP